MCSSPQWAALLNDELLPWVLDGCWLGDELLEVGPGPGLATDVLRLRAGRVTAAELDPGLAAGLAGRLRGTNVRVVRADASCLPFADGRFTGAACMTMLHHIPSAAAQDAALAELRRVLRPGGMLAGCDGLDTPDRRRLHHDDIFVPVDQRTLGDRLRRAGFAEVKVAVRKDRIGFTATARPAGAAG